MILSTPYPSPTLLSIYARCLPPTLSMKAGYAGNEGTRYECRPKTILMSVKIIKINCMTKRMNPSVGWQIKASETLEKGKYSLSETL